MKTGTGLWCEQLFWSILKPFLAAAAHTEIDVSATKAVIPLFVNQWF
jgi:hypothetical protein